MKRAKLFLSVFLLTIVIFGLSELAYENDVFAVTLVPCCNNSQCSYPNIPCHTGSSMIVKEPGPKPGQVLCENEYIFTCEDCVNLNAAGLICDDPLNSCEMNGHCYGWCYYQGGWGWYLSK